METIVIAFSIKETTRGSDEYATEYCRQLRMQEQGLKELTIREYLENRQNYKEQDNPEEEVTQKREREKVCNIHIAELQNPFPVFSTEDTIVRINRLYEWVDSQVALITQKTEETQIAAVGVGKAKVGEPQKQVRGQGWAEKFEETIHQQKQTRETGLISLYRSNGLTSEDQKNAMNEAMNKWEKEESLSVELAPKMMDMFKENP